VLALLLAAAVSGMLSLFGTRYVIIVFRRLGRGQPILGKDERNLVAVDHEHKAGTPTMGGIAILGAAFAGYMVAHIRKGVVFSDQVLIMFVGIFLLSLVGFIDDFLKVRRRHNRGLFWKRKNLIVLATAAVPVVLLAQTTSISQTVSFTRADWPGWELSPVLYILWGTFIVFATAHAVNVTDGLDGLAAGSGMLSFFGFAVIAFWGFRNPEIFPMVNPLDLAVLAVAFAAACGGFLWWNAAPARVFMGDVGALGMGGALGLLALTSNTQLLLPILCGLNVIEIGSVAVQMGVFRISGRRKRLFRIAPIHHHFEKGDQPWPETTIIIRFWLIAGIFVAVALGIFIADFTRLAREINVVMP